MLYCSTYRFASCPEVPDPKVVWHCDPVAKTNFAQYIVAVEVSMVHPPRDDDR